MLIYLNNSSYTLSKEYTLVLLLECHPQLLDVLRRPIGRDLNNRIRMAAIPTW